MSPKNAQIIAAQSVEWLASNDDIFQSFLNVSGCEVENVQPMIENLEFQTSVLDFLMTDDSYIIAFCDVFSIAYEDIAKARVLLPGGDAPHWV